MSTAEPAVRAVNVRKTYGKGDTSVVALDGVNIEFIRGKFTAIMGPSGSGKSTLMHVTAGLDGIDSGAIYLGSTNIGELKERALTLLRRTKVGFIFQAFNLVPTLTAIENITLPLDLAGQKPEKAWLDQIVERVGLGDRLSHRPSQLSGGQQQRVAVARALVSKPEIVFADEPTGNLDSNTSANILKFLREAADEFGQTVVMVTHDANAASYAHRVVFLVDGRVVDDMESPTSGDVLDRMKKLGQ